MGIPYPVITLIDATPYRLRYLIDSNNPAGAGSVAISNQGAASPDLQTDALQAVEGKNQLPLLHRALQTVVANQAEARKVLLDDDTSPTPAQVGKDGYRVRCKLTPRGAAVPFDRWSVDANEGSAVFPALLAGSAVLWLAGQPVIQGTGSQWYLDVHLIHTAIDGE